MIQQAQRGLRELIGRRAILRAWRGTPGDLMAIAQRMRDLIAPRREAIFERRRAEIEQFFDNQIAEARRVQPPEQLPGAIEALLRAKGEARDRAVAEAVAAYEEFFSVTLENDVIIAREPERLFTATDFPPNVKAVNMTVRMLGQVQIVVALAKANPYVPQLEVYVSADDPAWMEGSIRSMMEVIERGQNQLLKHWRWWIQPYVVGVLVWAFLSWFLAVLLEYLKVPILSSYSWLAAFLATFPAAGVMLILQEAIPPFRVSRPGQQTTSDFVVGVIVTVVGAVLIWILSEIGLWLLGKTR